MQEVAEVHRALAVLGRANWRMPDNLDGTTVFPNRVASYVNGLCPASIGDAFSSVSATDAKIAGSSAGGGSDEELFTRSSR